MAKHKNDKPAADPHAPAAAKPDEAKAAKSVTLGDLFRNAVLTLGGDFAAYVGGRAMRETFVSDLVGFVEDHAGKPTTLKAMRGFAIGLRTWADAYTSSRGWSAANAEFLKELLDELGDGIITTYEETGAVTDAQGRGVAKAVFKSRTTWARILGSLPVETQAAFEQRLAQYRAAKNNEAYWRFYRDKLTDKDALALAQRDTVAGWDAYLDRFGDPPRIAIAVQSVLDGLPQDMEAFRRRDAERSARVRAETRLISRQREMIQNINPQQPEQPNVFGLLMTGALLVCALIAWMIYT
jgi:GNAT superfamily N-acetyltransferase